MDEFIFFKLLHEINIGNRYYITLKKKNILLKNEICLYSATVQNVSL